METVKHELIILDYTEYPGPRYCIQGDHSGEDFYHTSLNQAFMNALSEKSVLTVDLDGTAGYASSFLDEAFGNLVYDFSLEIVASSILIISKQEPDWIEMIKTKVMKDWEVRRTSNDRPKKTQYHNEWYRFVDGSGIKKVWITI